MNFKSPTLWVLYTLISFLAFCSSLQAQTNSISLNQGWNLISLPLQPANNSIDQVLSGVQGKFEAVYSFDTVKSSYKSYVAGGDENDLTSLEAGKGYWLYMTEAAELRVTGSPAPSSISLFEGWNLVGLNSTAALSATKALESINTKISAVYTFDGASNAYKGYVPGEVSELTQMEPGRGYWIYSNENISWTLPSEVVTPKPTPQNGPFKHPGILNSKEELDFIAARVNANQEPWLSGYKALFAEGYDHGARGKAPMPVGSLDWKIRALPEVRDTGSNDKKGHPELTWDAQAAYAHALQWYIKRDPRNAKMAIDIMNAWAKTCKSFTGRGMLLIASWGGSFFLPAAEIMAHSDSGWAPSDIERFKKWTKDVMLPVVENFGPTGFNGNWAASANYTVIAIAVFTDDKQLFDKAVNQYLKGPHKGSLPNYVRENGTTQETSRDYIHEYIGVGGLVYTAEVAWHQGVDLYGAMDNRLLKGVEGSCSRTFNKKKIVWPEVAYNHYVNRKKLSAPNAKKLVEWARPAGSTGYALCTTLTHAELPPL
jgi:hypothetical protein